MPFYGEGYQKALEKGRSRILNGVEQLATALEHRQGQAKAAEVEQLEKERKIREDRESLSPRSWFEGQYFCGAFIDSFYPKLRDIFYRIFEEQYHEIIFGGATRYGKTTLALAINGYALYLTSCMGSPQRNLHLMEQSPLLFLNMNVTDLKAKTAYFQKLSAWIRSTPYFMQEFSPKSNIITRLEFPKYISCRCSGASVTAPESEDLCFFVGDEVNLYDVVEGSRRARDGKKFDEATLIEAAVHRRMNGTFMKSDGSFPDICKIVWLCKETYPNSFIRRRIKEVKRNNLNRPGKVFILESTEWGMKPDDTYEKKYFYIRTASRNKSSKILESHEVDLERREVARRESDETVVDDEKYKVFEVPLVHYEVAKKNLEQFIRDGCGYPTEAISRYIKDREVLRRSIRSVENGFARELCEHPFDCFESNLMDDRGFLGLNCIQREVDGEQAWRPIHNPSVVRYIHIDAGLTTDPMGFAMGHQAGWKSVSRYDSQCQKMITEIMPIIWIDAMLRILPITGYQVSFSAARNLIRKMVEFGFMIGKVTMDSYQHVALSQPLKEDGFEVEIVSMDRTMDAYDFMEYAFYEERMSVYDYPIFYDEIVLLERVVTNQIVNGRVVVKVDHQPGEKKDVSDAVAGVVWQVELAAKKSKPMGIAAVPMERENTDVREAKQNMDLQTAFERGDYEKMYELSK